VKLRRRDLFGLAVGGSAALLLPRSGSAAPQHKSEFNVLPLRIANVVVQDGQLVANGTLGRHTFTAPLTLALSPNQPEVSALQAVCPVLDLALGPIHLDLLGLIVDTSPICLEITADPAGGLLGSLLCAIGQLLSGGALLGAILGGLSPADLAALLQGLADLLNGALAPATSSAALGGVSGTQAGACDILNLALGPLSLNLLGLLVNLDDCDGGPVTVDITANPAGGLLGSLLCALANLLNGPAAAIAVLALLARIARVINDLVNA
jgi:hypothetical protein